MTTSAAPPVLESESSEPSVSVSSLELRAQNPDSFLYVELAKAHLGERAAEIVGLLIAKGRLSAREMCEKTELDLKSVKTTLVSLIQLRCVQYLEETAFSGRKTTYYYFCEDGLLLMLYAGEIVETIRWQMQSDAAAQIVQNVLALGSLTVRNYMESGIQDMSQSEISALFVRLCEFGYLVPLTVTDYTTVSDLWNRLYTKEYSKIPKNSTLSDLKKRTEAKQKAKEQFSALLSKPDLSKLIVTNPQTSLRQVVDTIPLTFSLHRYLKTKRSKHLVHFASARVGSTPASIYKIALFLTERASPEIIDPLTKTGLLQDIDEQNAFHDEATLAEEKAPGVTFNAIDISKYLPESMDLRGSLISKMKTLKRGRASAAENQTSKKVKTEDGFVVPPPPSNSIGQDLDLDEEEEIDLDMDEDVSDPHSISLINGHLKLLSSSRIPFLQEAQPGLFFVPYTKLTPLLKSSVYDSIISFTLGQSAARILRCVRANSLVTEKVINSMALMKEKDIRCVIASLINYNAVEIQEVPRTADRAASRSVFLFRNNEKHAYDLMKLNLTWNIANLLHKTEELKDDNSTLLTKANRDDVKGREEELLLPSEINQLKMVNERELNGVTRNMRLLSLWEVFKFF